MAGPQNQFNFKTLFVSDFHLGGNKTAAPYLYEFLSKVDFTQVKDIYLVGDVIGGWEHQSSKQRPFPEMEKRVMDIINYAAQSGVKVHLIPGNHDEKLRPLVDVLQKRKSHDTFSPNIFFEQEAVFETGGTNNKKFKVVHGDQYDPKLFSKKWFRPIALLTSMFYDGLNYVDYFISTIIRKTTGLRMSLAKPIGRAFNNVVDFFVSHGSLRQGLEKAGLDGILMGHTHLAQEKTFGKGKKFHLINAGDWVENCSFAYAAKDGDIPKVIDYKKERDARDFGAVPTENDVHPAHFAAMRDRTDQQIRMVHILWPARDHQECEVAFNRFRYKIREYQKDMRELTGIMGEIDKEGTVDETKREKLLSIIDSTGLKAVGKRLKVLFNKYSPSQKFHKEDLKATEEALKDVLEESQEVVEEHKKAIEKPAKKLNIKFRS